MDRAKELESPRSDCRRPHHRDPRHRCRRLLAPDVRRTRRDGVTPLSQPQELQASVQLPARLDSDGPSSGASFVTRFFGIGRGRTTKQLWQVTTSWCLEPLARMTSPLSVPPPRKNLFRIVARSFTGALGRAEAYRRDHVFDLDRRRSLTSHGLRRAAGGQAGRGGSAGGPAKGVGDDLCRAWATQWATAVRKSRSFLEGVAKGSNDPYEPIRRPSRDGRGQAGFRSL